MIVDARKNFFSKKLSSVEDLSGPSKWFMIKKLPHPQDKKQEDKKWSKIIDKETSASSGQESGRMK